MKKAPAHMPTASSRGNYEFNWNGLSKSKVSDIATVCITAVSSRCTCELFSFGDTPSI